MRDTAPDAGRPLLPIDDYLGIVLAAVEPLRPERVPVSEALGLVPTEVVRASGDLPPFATSGMDGFAVRSADIAGAEQDRPVVLRLAGHVAMGRAPEVRLGEGEAMSIATGGAVPDGADVVVPIEFCTPTGIRGSRFAPSDRGSRFAPSDRGSRFAPSDRGSRFAPSERVAVHRALGAGDYVRGAGGDVRAGDVLVEPGRSLTPPDLGVLAAAGLERVEVRPSPRVGVLSTGDEVVRPGSAPARGQIYDANFAMISGAVAECGARVLDLGVVADDPEALKQTLRSRVADVDCFVSSGGVSVGERDPVKRAFAGSGDVELYELAMQPGKPQAFGAFCGLPFFGLPGNPVSVFVSFELFVRPALGKMAGRELSRPVIEVVLDEPLSGLPRKTRFVRLAVRRDGDRFRAAPTGGHGSNLVGALARGHGLGVIEPGEGLRAGEVCRVMLFREIVG